MAKVEFFVSPSKAIIRLLVLPSFASAVPYAFLVATYTIREVELEGGGKVILNLT